MIMNHMFAQSIQTVDYENELEVMVLTSVMQGDNGYHGTVHLHDNQTGQLLKHITLEEPWAEVCKQYILFSLFNIYFSTVFQLFVV